ncbi:hypothetical protein ABZP36_033637 [Zizania latifolia]
MGINVIMFYAPGLFKTLGFGGSASLMSAVITGGVNMAATLVSLFTVDRVGRRALFLQGGAQMLVSQVTVGALIGAKLGWSGVSTIPAWYATAVVVVMCAYVAVFAWSWGPLAWLVPSEAFLPMLCRLKFLLFFFFAAWVTVMTLFVALFVPETRGVPIEDMANLWSSHWYWRRFVHGADDAGHLRDIEMGTK